MRQSAGSTARAAGGLLETGVLSAGLFAVWVALTLGFMVGGVAVVGTAVTVLGQVGAFASILVTIGGVLAVSVVSPAVAGFIVVTAADRSRGVFDHDAGVVAVLRDVIPCEFGDSSGCGSACGCCC